MKFIALWLCLACILMFITQGFIGTDSVILDSNLKFSEPWRLITSLFAHSGMGHLLSNLFALGLFGLILEGRIGSKKVLWLFLISGLLINLLTPYPKSLGASGAIFAILGALAVLRPLMMVWVSGMPLPMILAGLIWFLQDALGLFVPSNIGHIAHISGLFMGLGAGFYWRKRFGDKLKRRKKDPHLEKKLDDWERTWQ